VAVDDGVLVLSELGADEGEPGVLLQYEWRVAEPSAEARQAMAQADELARRISQQILRIDPDGKLSEQPSPDPSAKAAPIERLLDLPGRVYRALLVGRRSNILALKYLRITSGHLRHYIRLYMQLSTDPKNLERSVKALEAQLVNGGLRYRVQVLMRQALLAVGIAIFIYCLGWLGAAAASEIFESRPDVPCVPESGFGSGSCWSLFSLLSYGHEALDNIKTFIVLAIGLFSGRFLYIFMSMPGARDTFDNYYLVERQFDTPVTDIFADNFVAFCATILFLSGIIVIGVGGDSSDDGTWTFGNINTMNLGSAEVAMGFGILIGLARQQFLGRLSTVAQNTVS